MNTSFIEPTFDSFIIYQSILKKIQFTILSQTYIFPKHINGIFNFRLGNML